MFHINTKWIREYEAICEFVAYKRVPTGALIKYSILSLWFIDVISQPNKTFWFPVQLGFLCIKKKMLKQKDG